MAVICSWCNTEVTCRQCISDFRPDDPRVKSGRYHLSSCDYCTKEYDLEELASIKLPPWQDKQWETIKQLRGMVLFLQGKVNEQQAKVGKQQYTIE